MAPTSEVTVPPPAPARCTVSSHVGWNVAVTLRGTEGLLRHAVRELIQLRTIRAHMSDERLGTIDRKLRFAGVAWMVELVRTLERYRVHYGGAPRRT